jgi:hypothetical protein
MLSLGELLFAWAAGAQRPPDLSISLDLSRPEAYPLRHEHNDLQNLLHYYLLRFSRGRVHVVSILKEMWHPRARHG